MRPMGRSDRGDGTAVAVIAKFVLRDFGSTIERLNVGLYAIPSMAAGSMPNYLLEMPNYLLGITKILNFMM